MAAAQRIALVGLSKVAKKPSPAVAISRPRNRSSSLRTIVWWSSSSSRQLLSPSARACSVEPTMSVKSTVVSTRSGSGTPRVPVTSSWISESTASAAPAQGQ
jgi:hypothetical protein